nr:CrcB family protein [Microbacterium amylolyticum]
MVGGAVGALTRWLLMEWDSSDFWVILAINVVGSMVLGFLVGVLGARHQRWRALLGTGMLGGFTSYSALAPLMGVSVFSGWAASLPYLAVLVATVIVGVAGALVGLASGGRLSRSAREGVA